MDAKEASIDLAAHLKGLAWPTAIGVGAVKGKPCLILYANKLGPALVWAEGVDDSWQGFPILVRKMSKPGAGSAKDETKRLRAKSWEPYHREEDTDPYQDNAIRDLEDGYND